MLFLFLFLLGSTLPGTANSANASCTVEDQHAALEDMYTAWRGPQWHNKGGWLNTTMQCVDSGVQLPAHCCWHGIDCCLKRTCFEYERFDINRCDCEPGLTWSITLDADNLEGNFSSLDHSAFACSLYGLRVPNNKLFGPIGQDFTLHRKLGYAELQQNSLQGTLPKGIGDNYSLFSFIVAGNDLVGPVPPDICGNYTKLFFLSVEKNRLSGELDLAKCLQLGYLFAEGNNFSTVFTGEIPPLPTLRAVHLGQNNLVGMLPKQDFMSLMPSVEELDVFGNQLSGPLPDITMYTLQHVGLSDNRFTGPIPETWSRMAQPSFHVFLQTNYLSCCGTNALPFLELTLAKEILRIDEVYQGVDYNRPRLPPFLEFSDALVPVRVAPRQSFKAPGLRCPQLKLSKSMDFEPTPEHPTSTLQWYLDPSYYMWEGCECEEGLTLVNLTKPGRLPYLECQAIVLNASDDQSWEEQYPWAIVIIVVVGCALLITLLLGLYLYKGTEVVQRLNNLKKRMHGLPTSGPFTAVVTDIQGWTELCSQYPELSWKVLSIHNSILRKARWNNFGSTHQTEGDSFTMVFYCAKDAVAFCLQAQQMLSMQQWPSQSEAISEEQSSATPLMTSYGNPVSDRSLKKSRSTNSFSLLSLSNSKPYHSMDQGKNADIDVRVRMGLASGFLCPGESLHAHPTIEYAKEVSDAAMGGQILMESSTFLAIKDSLGELGTVDAQGMHLDRLRMRRLKGRFSWPACFRSIAPTAANSEDAIVLDMGTYTKPSVDQDRSKQTGAPRTSPSRRPPVPRRSSRSFMYARGVSTTGFAQRTANSDDLHLYQVLSAAGAERAKLWGNNLRLKAPLKDSLSKGYFDAPGTMAAPLGISKSPAGADLPQVTTVFASVEHARVFSSKEIRMVEQGLLACARHCLDLEQVQGDGYLCRSFGNLKLMLCFSKLQAALAWSCAMQECMMVQPWPRVAFREPLQEKRDQHGKMIFRGPRLKIGINEGRPDSIQPDHLGRADYHGDCVNSAARFMEGAAQGGMIACEQEVATRAAEAWAAMRSTSDAEHTNNAGLQTRSCSASLSVHPSCEQQQPPRALAKLSLPHDKGQLKTPANSRTSPTLDTVQPPLLEVPVHAPIPSIGDGVISGSQQNLGNIYIFWLGLFNFKGIAHKKRMVHVLQEKLSSRAAKFTPKSANPAVASLASQQQSESPFMSTYLAPLPAIDTELAASPQEQGVRVASVRFELEGSHHSDMLLKMSEPSGKGVSEASVKGSLQKFSKTLSGRSVDIALSQVRH